MKPRTYVLRERAPRGCRLTRADVDFLLEEHRRHVEVRPTSQRGTYQLTARGYAGVIVAPACRFVLRPKVPLENLFGMLDPAGTPPDAQGLTEATPDAGLLDVLAHQLARLLDERVAAGLHRGYVERAEPGPFLQGRLDVAAQVRAGAPRRHRLHCRFDTFTADVPCNQVPRATAERLLLSPLLSETSRAALHRSLAGFAEVSSVPLDASAFTAAAPDRQTEAYRPLWELCRLLADGLPAGAKLGETRCHAFLLDMEQVFECYVARQLRASFRADEQADALTVVVQPWFQAAPRAEGQPDLHFRPDLTLSRAGQRIAALDTKWKRLPRERLLAPDVYQVLAYCTLLGLRHALLVYPGRRDRQLRYRLKRSAVRLDVYTLRVVGPHADCLRSAEGLARDVDRAVRREAARSPPSEPGA